MAGPWRTLVDAPTLHEHLDDPNLVVLDVRYALGNPTYGLQAWREGHVPGAIPVDMETELTGPRTPQTGRHPVPDIEDFQAACSRWGVEDGVQVVAYDDRGGIFASRVWWLLHDYGHPDVAVLDGGYPAWVDAGYPTSQDAPRPRGPTRFRGVPGHMRTVTTWDLTTREPRRLLDARPETLYRGEEAAGEPVAGHIPHAHSVPTGGNLDEQDRFLKPEELRARYTRILAGRAPRDSAVYCLSGLTAPHDILAMTHAGLPGAALYPGSWSEWVRNPHRPVALETREE